METYPPNLLVGAFESREAAEAAKRDLAARGIGSTPASGEPHHRPYDPKITRKGGMRDLIENMFGGFVGDVLHRPRAGGHGPWLVVVRGVPAQRHADVREVLSKRGTFEALAVRDEPAAVEAEVAIYGPDVGALPQGTGGSNEAAGRERVPVAGSADPGRPRNVLDDAMGLDPLPPARFPR
jgi:hypothetical protein